MVWLSHTGSLLAMQGSVSDPTASWACLQCLSNYSHCHKREKGVLHCRFKLEKLRKSSLRQNCLQFLYFLQMEHIQMVPIPKLPWNFVQHSWSPKDKSYWCFTYIYILYTFIITIIGWIVMKFVADIVPLRSNCNNFHDLITFPQNLNVSNILVYD